MFEGVFDWREALGSIAERFQDNGIEWYIIGSTSEAVLGVEVAPHDLDLIVQPKDFFRVKTLFADCVVEPFVDNQGTWLVRYFGRLCLAGAMVDIAADDKMNRDKHQYDRVSWNGHQVYIEPLQARYQTELARERTERIAAIETYMKASGAGSPAARR
jgi:predicted nucleotidyltransferase